MSKPSPFVWYELMTSDAPAAEAFYRSVCGWTTADAGMPGQPYTLLSAGPAMVGGLMAIPDDARAIGRAAGLDRLRRGRRCRRLRGARAGRGRRDPPAARGHSRPSAASPW
jgi:catechol 2,3-dioxygenase-like lactoylglutathione lyase family enzyme